MKKIALDTNIVVDILNGKIETAETIKEYQILSESGFAGLMDFQD